MKLRVQNQKTKQHKTESTVQLRAVIVIGRLVLGVSRTAWVYRVVYKFDLHVACMQNQTQMRTRKTDAYPTSKETRGTSNTYGYQPACFRKITTQTVGSLWHTHTHTRTHCLSLSFSLFAWMYLVSLRVSHISNIRVLQEKSHSRFFHTRRIHSQLECFDLRQQFLFTVLKLFLLSCKFLFFVEAKDFGVV